MNDKKDKKDKIYFFLKIHFNPIFLLEMTKKDKKDKKDKIFYIL
jgi:hypothetical protein